MSHGDQRELNLDDGVEIPDGRRWVKIYEPRPGQFRNKLEQSVFFDLVVRAQWRAGKVRFRGRDCTLGRGQLVVVVTNLAAEFGMTRKAMRTILDHLRTADRISMRRIGIGGRTAQGPNSGQSKVQIATLISITNYDTYQQRTVPKGQGKGQGRATQGPIEQESIESKNKQPPAQTGAAGTDVEIENQELSVCYATAREVLENDRAAAQFVTRAHRKGMPCDEILRLLQNADHADRPIAYCYGGLSQYRKGERARDRWARHDAKSKLDRRTSGEKLTHIGGSRVYIDGKWRPLKDLGKTPEELKEQDRRQANG